MVRTGLWVSFYDLKYIFKFYLAKEKLYLRLETRHDASQASVYPTVATTAVEIIWEVLVM